MTDIVTALTILLPIMIILLILSCFFSATETAITSINIIRLKQIAKSRKYYKNQTQQIKQIKRVYHFIKNYDQTLITILIANTLINTSLATIGALFFSILIRNEITATWITTSIIGVIILIIGEIIPKIIVKKNPEKFSIFSSHILFFWKIILSPFTWIINLKRKKNNAIISTTENELLELISTIEIEGVLEKNEKQLIESAIIFDEKNIEYVMQNKEKVKIIFNDIKWQELKYIYKKKRFTRMPVIDRKSGEIIGILNIKDVLIFLIENKEIKISELSTKPIYISKNLKLDDALELFQQKQSHLAIVTPNNNSKKFLGIVTLEDIIEELVGEIYDEYDLTGRVKEIGHHMFWINSNTPLKKVFKKYLKLNPPSKTEGKTLYEWYIFQINKQNEKNKYKNKENKEFIYNNFAFRINNSKNYINKYSSKINNNIMIEIEILTNNIKKQL